MMAPDGSLCSIPEENVEAAKEAGFKEMTDTDMERLYNRLFLAEKFFEQKHPPMTRLRLPRGRGRW
jgi:hypothetical protein